MNNSYPRLIADIGGTNARFALESAPFTLSHIDVLPCADYDSLLAAIRAYVAKNAVALPRHVGIAIANPVRGDWVQMTNHHWCFSIQAMQAALGVETLQVVNDFTAQALAITQMDSAHITPLMADTPAPNLQDVCAVIGPGTGLGVSGLIPDGRGGSVALAGEGGHVSFSPADALEGELQAFAAQRFAGHVSAERLLQGDGLTLIYRFLAERQGITPSKHTPAEVTNGALVEKDAVCIEVLSRYCMILGGFCANVSLTLGARGGVYIAGGIIPRFVDFVRDSDFRKRFEEKGRFADYLRDVPVYVVEHQYPGLLGAAVALNNALNNAVR